MPDLEGVIDDIRKTLVASIAPYQPNIPPLYPNKDPRANSIPPTLVTSGHPLQYHVTTRLENHGCQICVYAGTHGSDFSFVNRDASSLVDLDLNGIVNIELARAVHEVIIELWCFSRESRVALGSAFFNTFGDFIRIDNASDGTTTLLRYEKELQLDFEQTDSIYLRQYIYNADYVVTEQLSVSPVLRTAVGLSVTDPTTGTSTLVKTVNEP